MKNFILILLVLSSLFGQAQNWSKADLGSLSSLTYFTKVHFINDNEGLVIGLNATLFRTIDGGFTWNEIQTGATHHFQVVSFADENVGFINGLKTEDGGATWVPQESTLSFTFLHAINENHLIGNTQEGANYYQESWDGGVTWDSIPIPTLFDSDIYGYYPNGYSSINDQTAYLSLRKGIIDSADSLNILKTNDGGNSWNPIVVPIPNPPPSLGFNGFKGIAFPSENIGLLIHNKGIVKTSDGGNTFSEVIPESRPEYWEPVTIYAASTDHYLLVGLKPFITETSVSMYETLDGGLTWVKAIFAPGNEYLSDVFCTSNNCFAVGGKVVYHKFDRTTTSIQNLKEEEIKISPNPTTDYLQLETENIRIDNIEIIDVNGKLYNQFAIGNNVLDISSLPPGIFFLKIEYQDKVNTIRFLKK